MFEWLVSEKKVRISVFVWLFLCCNNTSSQQIGKLLENLFTSVILLIWFRAEYVGCTHAAPMLHPCQTACSPLDLFWPQKWHGPCVICTGPMPPRNFKNNRTKLQREIYLCIVISPLFIYRDEILHPAAMPISTVQHLRCNFKTGEANLQLTDIPNKQLQ